MVSVASQLIEEVTAHAQSDSLEDAQEIFTDGTYFPNNLRTYCKFHLMTWWHGKVNVVWSIYGSIPCVMLWTGARCWDLLTMPKHV